MNRIILGRFERVTADTAAFLAGVGVAVEKGEANVHVSIEVARVPEELKALDRAGYFPTGERHIWPLEKIDGAGVLIIVQYERRRRGIRILREDVLCVSRLQAAPQEQPDGVWRPSRFVKERGLDDLGVPQLSAGDLEEAAHEFLME